MAVVELMLWLHTCSEFLWNHVTSVLFSVSVCFRIYWRQKDLLACIIWSCLFSSAWSVHDSQFNILYGQPSLIKRNAFLTNHKQILIIMQYIAPSLSYKKHLKHFWFLVHSVPSDIPFSVFSVSIYVGWDNTYSNVFMYLTF